MIYVIDIDGIIGTEPLKKVQELFDRPLLPTNPDVIKKINKLYKKNKIILYTARPKTLRFITIIWLKNHNVRYHKLIMGKPMGDYYVDNKMMNKEDFLNLK